MGSAEYSAAIWLAEKVGAFGLGLILVLIVRGDLRLRREITAQEKATAAAELRAEKAETKVDAVQGRLERVLGLHAKTLDAGAKLLADRTD
jgi:hypothetical protein